MLVAAMMACCAMLARIETLGFSRRRAITLMLAALAMLLTHYLGAAILLAMILYAALRLTGDLRRRVIGILVASLLIALLAWGPMLYEQLHMFSKISRGWSSRRMDGGFAWRSDWERCRCGSLSIRPTTPGRRRI